MKLKIEDLQHIYPNVSKQKLELYLDCLNRNLNKFGINTIDRAGAFLTCVYFESKAFSEKEEEFLYSPEYLRKTWPHLFLNSFEALRAVSNKKQLANLIYSNKHGNGDFHSGEGFVFRGRGLLKIKYKSYYEKLSAYTGIDFVDNPDLLHMLEYSVLSSCWMWQEFLLNEECDNEDFEGVCRILFGNLEKILDKKRFYKKTKRILNDLVFN